MTDLLAREPGIYHRDEMISKEWNVVEFLGQGGSGEVYRVSNAHFGPTRALKLYFPFYHLKQLSFLHSISDDDARSQTLANEAETLTKSRSEFRYLTRLDHPFVVAVHDYDHRHKLDDFALQRLSEKVGSTLKAFPIPRLLTSYIAGTSLDRLDFASLSEREVHQILIGIAQALDYVHNETQLLHLDIRPGNVVVRDADALPVLVDFALSQDVSPDASQAEKLHVAIDSSLLPTLPRVDRNTELRSLTYGERTRAEIRDRFFPYIDHFQFGKLLASLHPRLAGQLPASASRYLELLSAYLTDWRKLRRRPPQRLEALVERADSKRTYPVLQRPASPDSQYLPAPNGPIEIPERHLRLQRHPELARLHRFYQLGLLPARFPGATFSRYLHSVDTFRVCRQAMRALLQDPTARWLLSPSAVDMALVVSLVHDVNHIPMMHVYQESDLPVFRREELDLHRVALEQSYGSVPTLAELLAEEYGLGTDRLIRLIHGEWDLQAGPDLETDQAISSIVNSGVDIDKISYLALDALSSGIRFDPRIDVWKLFTHARVVEYTETTGHGDDMRNSVGYHIAFGEATLDFIEAIVRARRTAFEKLYWSPENRAMMALLLDVARQIAGAGKEIALKQLLVETRGLPDYSALAQVDGLANQAGLDAVSVASFFETETTMPVSLWSSTRVTGKLRALSPSDRASIDASLRDSLRDLTGLSSASRVTIDVPRRDLDLGGRILIEKRNGDIRPAFEVSALVKTERDRLQNLSQLTRVFGPAALDRAIEDKLPKRDDRSRWFEKAILASIQSSFS